MKKNCLLFLMSVLSMSTYAQPCNFQWVHSLGTLAVSNSVTTDAAGDVYVTGYYYGTVDFDPGPAIFNLTANGGLSDAFIQKLTSNGDLVWAKSIGGLGWAGGSSITTDAAGNLYITGFYTGTVDFDPGVATFNLTSNGSGDVFIEKLTTNGNFVWAKSVGGLSWDVVNYITTNSAGDIYLTGYYYGTVDFDPSPTIFNLTSNGDKDVFIEKLTTNGNFVWAKSIGGGTSDEAKSIVTDAVGNVYITGFYTGTADFDPGAATFNFTSNGGSDIFIEKLTANGNFVWAKSIGGSGTFAGDIATSIVTDAVGNIYVGGGFSATVDFDPGPAIFNLSEPTNGGSRNIFIEKLDTNGKFIWAKSIGASSNDFVSAMTIDNLGNLYVTGSYFSTVDFDPGPATFNLTATPIDTSGPFLFGNFTEIFIEKLDTNGQFIWAKSIGGPKEEQSTAIVADDSGNVYVSGYFYGTADFDPGVGTFNLIGLDTNNMFILKLSNLTVSVIENNLFSEVTIFPNPTEGLVNINLGKLKDVSIKVMDISGQLVYHQTHINTSVHQFKLNVTTGLYFLEIIDAAGEKSIRKIIVN